MRVCKYVPLNIKKWPTNFKFIWRLFSVKQVFKNCFYVKSVYSTNKVFWKVSMYFKRFIKAF